MDLPRMKFWWIALRNGAEGPEAKAAVAGTRPELDALVARGEFREYRRACPGDADDVLLVRQLPAGVCDPLFGLHVPFDLADHLGRQRAFSARTFGPGARTAGVVDHIRRELLEIEAAPGDLSEWIDIVLLGLDGAWRAGFEPEEIVAALAAKQARNESRTWPDWRTQSPDKAIEHDRTVA